MSLTGVITKVEWTNPHMHVYIDVTDASGKVTNWNMEMASPNTVQRQGWGRNTLLPGDKVVFEGYGGKVVESHGALARSRKATSPTRRCSSRADRRQSGRDFLDSSNQRCRARLYAAPGGP